MTNCGGIINMEVCLLDTLAMIALGIRQTEQALFQEITTAMFVSTRTR
jgi:hypothetical protein